MLILYVENIILRTNKACVLGIYRPPFFLSHVSTLNANKVVIKIADQIDHKSFFHYRLIAYEEHVTRCDMKRTCSV